MKNLGSKTIRTIFMVQAILTSLIALGLWVLADANKAASALLGGMAAIVPIVLFARFVFRHRGALAAKKIVNNFYLGEMAKIMLSGVLFALIFQYLRVAPIVFFITYGVVTISFGFLPLLLRLDK